MKPETPDTAPQDQLFRHRLARSAARIDWDAMNQMHFLDHGLLLTRQPAKYIAQFVPDLPEYRLLAVLRDKHDVIFHSHRG